MVRRGGEAADLTLPTPAKRTTTVKHTKRRRSGRSQAVQTEERTLGDP